MRWIFNTLIPVTVFSVGVLSLGAAFLEPPPAPRPTPVRESPTTKIRFFPLKIETQGLPRYDVSFRVKLPSSSSELLLATSRPHGIIAEISRGRAGLGILAAGNILRETGSNLAASSEHLVVLKRRENRFHLIVDGALAGSVAWEDIPPERFEIGGEGQVEDVRFLPIREEILFADDFMREGSERSPWETVSGMWRTVGLKNPSLSANPFRLSATGAKAISVCGAPFWDEYTASVSVMGAPGQSFGIIFSYRDENDYLLFKIHAVGENAPPAELIRVRNGGVSVLSSAQTRFTPGVWYRLSLSCSPGWAGIKLDGRKVLEANDPFISEGRFGLFSDGSQRTWFDDVVIGPWKRSVLDGRSNRSLFYPLSGNWSSNNGVLRLSALNSTAGPGDSVPALFYTPWTGSEMKMATVLLQGEGGLAAGVSDPLNWSGLVLRNGKAEIVSSSNGQLNVLASSPISSSRSGVPLEITLRRGVLSARAAGKTLSAPVKPSGKGAALLALAPGTSFSLPATVELPERGVSAFTGNTTFSHEISMASWAAASSNWVRENDRTYWYQAFLPGDSELVAELDGREFAPSARVGLGLRKAGEGRMNGYNLVLERPPESPESDNPSQGVLLKASLFRQGRRIRETQLSLPKIYSAAIRVAGASVLAEINGNPVLSFADPAPFEITGYRAAYFSSIFEISPEYVLVKSPCEFNYSFETAPVDWRPASGRWEVSNRWQCDNRWSFFSGIMDKNPDTGRKDPLVLIWNKRRFSDPFRVDVFIGPKMRRERGRRYEYVRDFNIALSPDGRDTVSGYSFIFGGFNNTKSAILRKGKVVASSSSGIIKRSMWLHRHWYHLVVTKEGGRIRFTVDDGRALDLSFNDPDPLDVGRVGIWSYDCDIMVGRVKISGRGGTIVERPDTPLPRPRTLYDMMGGGTEQ